MSIGEVTRIGDIAVDDLPHRLGLAADLDQLKALLLAWVAASSAEMHAPLRWQLVARAKYFRPLTLFACYRAVSAPPISPAIMHSAVALELFHNVSLVIDDILDHSRHRRGKRTLHCRFGSLPTLMVSGYMTAGGFQLVADDAYSVRLLGELMQRLGVAECLQWRLRRHPLGVEDWRALAAEDTGSMFETCARLGTRDGRLAAFGRLLGILYHGCDDVGDARGLAALGGGGDADVRDGILTLPAAIAIRNPATAALFRNPDPANTPEMARRIAAAVPEAERYLDEIAGEARNEALRHARDPQPLLALIRYTRALSDS